MEAYDFAEKAHRGAYRKYHNSPYINHPLAVSNLAVYFLKRDHNVSNEDIDVGRKVSLLHDVPEDTDITISEIEDLFGQEVATNVYFLTNPEKPEGLSRKERKAIDRKHIVQGTVLSKTIKCCDRIHNLLDILKNDLDFALRYSRETRLLWKESLQEALPESKEALKFLIDRIERFYKKNSIKDREISQKVPDFLEDFVRDKKLLEIMNF